MPCQQTFENKKIADITQQSFALKPQVNFPANDLNFPEGKGDVIEKGYLLKSFLLYCDTPTTTYKLPIPKVGCHPKYDSKLNKDYPM